MLIRTADPNALKNVFKDIVTSQSESHKGQNGKLLIIGGSSLFHAASIWAAEVASHFVDMVHYATTPENEKIFHDAKVKFRNGMVISKKDLEEYVIQDDAILVGPGMMREGKEGQESRQIVEWLIDKHPDKKYVFDAGALQTMDKSWLKKLKAPAILTPHQKEFEMLFGISLIDKTAKEKEELVRKMAGEYNSVILLKAITDYVSDGTTAYEVEGGNAGLTKGGTGDVLAALSASFVTKSLPLLSAVAASVLLKKTADALHGTSGYWYNVGDIIEKLPEVLKVGIIDKS
jgi:NAD(P)H-hydrate epimerase